VFWGYGWDSSDQIAQQLGQHQSTIESLVREARSLKNENMPNMKRLWEAKRFS
jgi:IS30 family transposase